jgi:hypothetical protein
MFGTISVADLVINFALVQSENSVEFCDQPVDGSKVNVTTMDILAGTSKNAIVDTDKFTKALALAVLLEGRVPEDATEIHEFWTDAEEAVKDLHRIMP